MLLARIERIDDDLLGALDLGPTERTSLERAHGTERKQTLECGSLVSSWTTAHLSLRIDLPGGQAGRAQQVPARLDANVFVVLRADLAQLEGASCMNEGNAIRPKPIATQLRCHVPISQYSSYCSCVTVM